MRTFQSAAASDATPSVEIPLALPAQLAGFLGAMWSSIVCVGAGVWLLYSETTFLKVLVAFGVLMTGLTLHRAIYGASWRNVPATRGRPARHAWRA